MDSFTENILSKARQRVNLISPENSNKAEIETKTTPPKVLTDQNISKTPRSDKTAGKEKSNSQKITPKMTKTLSFQKENLNLEVKVTSSEEVMVEVEFEECSDADKNDGPALRKDVKDRLNRLGKLYAGGDDADISSPIHRTEEKFMADDKPKDTPVSTKHGKKLIKGLANLAEEMNRWEDDVKKSATKPEKTPLKWDKAVLDTLESQGFQRESKESKLVYNYPKTENKPQQEKKTPRNNTSNKGKIVKFQQPQINSPLKSTNDVPRTDFIRRTTTQQDPSSLSISERKALFEKNQGEILLPKAPFGMSIPLQNDKIKSNNNKSTKTNIVNTSTQSPKKDVNINQKIVTFENIKLKKVESPKADINKEDSCKSAPNKTVKTSNNKSESVSPFSHNFIKPASPKTTEESPVKAIVPQSGGIAHTVEALFKRTNTISEDQIQKQLKEERMKEMQVLMNRFKRKEIQQEVIEEEEETEDDSDTDLVVHKNKKGRKSDADEDVESPLVEKTNDEKPDATEVPRRSNGKRSFIEFVDSSVSPRVAAVLGDVKRIKVSPKTKPGRIYPSLSDIEAPKDTETEDGYECSSGDNSSIASFSGTLETSFGKEIMEAVCKNQTPVKRAIYDDSTASDVSDVLGDMDDYLDELEYEEGPTPPKMSKSKDSSFASHSFNYKDASRFKLPVEPEKSPERPQEIPVPHNEAELPLAYTVSFYRKQTNNAASPSPMKVVTRQENESVPEPDKQQEILAKIKFLQTEVQKLQLIIAQTSQALNLCNNTLEFMGSTEQVEAEKLLLISTNRRQAMLNEIQRLKVEGSLRPRSHNEEEIPIEKGVLTISDITLPLKKDYVRALAAAGGKGHHVICLVKCGEEVVSTKLVSTVATNLKNPCYDLTIPGSVSLKNIYNDSTVTFEVYCLQAQEEYLPHDVKYHIKKSKATPKKSKHDSLLSRPIKESPGGPQAVRSPSFALMGYVVFSVYKINRKSWSLNNSPSMSPLEGSVAMTASCELTASVEYRGFLTMFEDISGFGAWHRRWCLLKGDALRYWKYPDDEKTSHPINSIDLNRCITKEVGPVSRDICARLHTFLVETEREPLPQDKETLTTICKKDKTIIRHLLSADTKEERIKWCSQFNTILLASKICRNA